MLSPPYFGESAGACYARPSPALPSSGSSGCAKSGAGAAKDIARRADEDDSENAVVHVIEILMHWRMIASRGSVASVLITRVSTFSTKRGRMQGRHPDGSLYDCSNTIPR